jgi:hypothetical protein
MRVTACILAALPLLVGVPAHAGDSAMMSQPAPELRPIVGVFAPTGKLRKHVGGAVLTGAQVAYDLPIPARLVGTFAWSPSKAKSFQDTRTNLYVYDVGAEFARRVEAPSWRPNPFLGVGLGARTYSEKSSSKSETNVDAFGAIGAEAGTRWIGARIELRDYLSRFKGVTGRSKGTTVNDLMPTAGLTLRF